MKLNALVLECSSRVLAVVALSAAVSSSSYCMGPFRQVYPPQALYSGSGLFNTTAEVGTAVHFGAAAMGDLPMTYQWFKNGVAIRGASGSVTVYAAGDSLGPPNCSASFTIPNVQLSDAGEYAAVFENKYGKTGSARTALSVVVPEPAVIISQPASQRVYAGDALSFKVEANGTTLRYQWEKDGIAIAAATNATYTISKATVSDGAKYAVVVRGGGREVRSEPATLTVTTPTRPVVSAHPASQNVASGSAVVFHAILDDATAYQWQKNGVPVPGATSTSLLIPGVTSSNAGRYALVATNRAGSTVSNEAVLTVTSDQTAAGRLTNISILTSIAAGETLTIGTVLNSAFGSGSRPLLVRAAGPSLAPLGIGGVMRDPTITISEASSGAKVASNDDWSGTPILRGVFQAVGAFPFVDNNAKDAAVYQSALPVGNYIVEVKDAISAGGQVLAELYDAGGSSVSTATPRLLNVSVRKEVSTGNPLVTGFFVGGQCGITVLIRAVGPTLAATPFGIEGAMPNPFLKVFGGDGQILAANDNWGGDSQIAAAASRVGAFSLAGADSKDAVLVVTLPPGGYTAQVEPVDGTEGGTAVIEIYELR